ncbi:MAG: potassium-transporting ATPase subunit KdpC [Alphaproteobacteria bacterium]|nr:potassium-transporting ATPase subunit KdpC [Alphaproteobacteria bacterium]
MMKNILIAFKVCMFTILLTGILYPYLITGFSHIFFHKKARGSLVIDDQKKIIGSALIGQGFKNPAYFFSRPSAAGNGYDGMASGGMNDGPTSQKWVNRIQTHLAHLKAHNSEPIPIDLVTCSASGLDPHITPQAAYWQAPTVAFHRDVSIKRVVSIIDEHIEPPQLFILGSARINVLHLNLSLDQYLGPPVSIP